MELDQYDFHNSELRVLRHRSPLVFAEIFNDFGHPEGTCKSNQRKDRTATEKDYPVLNLDHATVEYSVGSSCIRVVLW